MKIWLPFLVKPLFFSALAGLAFCGCKPINTTGSSKEGSVAFTVSKWSKRTLIVCWVTPAESYIDQISVVAKDIAKRAVIREYNSRTNISFVGWKSCNDTPKADLRIEDFNDKSNPAMRGKAGGIGAINMEEIDLGIKQASAQRAPVRFNFISGCMRSYKMGGNSLNSCITFTALHEFGHVAGLTHEHSHPESTCRYKEDLESPGAVKTDYQISEKYDPSSIMNYCFRDEVYEKKLSADQIELSIKDIQGINQLYPTH